MQESNPTVLVWLCKYLENLNTFTTPGVRYQPGPEHRAPLTDWCRPCAVVWTIEPLEDARAGNHGFSMKGNLVGLRPVSSPASHADADVVDSVVTRWRSVFTACPLPTITTTTTLAHFISGSVLTCVCRTSINNSRLRSQQLTPGAKGPAKRIHRQGIGSVRESNRQLLVPCSSWALCTAGAYLVEEFVANQSVFDVSFLYLPFPWCAVRTCSNVTQSLQSGFLFNNLILQHPFIRSNLVRTYDHTHVRTPI